MLIKYEKKYDSDTFRARNVFFSKTLKPITELKKALQKKSYFFFNFYCLEKKIIHFRMI